MSIYGKPEQSEDALIPILVRHGRAMYIRDQSPYTRTGGLPWYRELTERQFNTKLEAWRHALQWARDYRADDRMGNLAHAFGVIYDHGTHKWVAVVNYYHSNT